jgi:hypothetical protein
MGAAMTHIRNAAAAALAASLFLSACNSEPERVGQNADPQAEALKNAPPVELPPSLIARTYRCSDNSLVYADFASDGSYAMVGTAENSRMRATAAQPGRNYSSDANGYTISANADDARIKTPGKSEQSCRAHNR